MTLIRNAGPWPWDQFEALALAAGVAPHLAKLGRAVMRDVAQHGLDPSITLGAADDGPLLIEWMTRAPFSAEFRLLCDQAFRTGVPSNDVDVQALQAIATRIGAEATDVQDVLRGEEEISAAALAGNERR